MMKNNKTYYEYITYKFEDLLKNSLFVIAKGANEHSYLLKNKDHCSLIDQKKHLSTVKSFMYDLQSYLYNGTALNFVYENNLYLYTSFSQSLFVNLFRNNPFHKEEYDESSDFNNLLEVFNQTKKYSNWEPTVEQLIKVVSLFKEGTIRVDNLFDELPRGLDSQGRDYKDFLLFLITIPNTYLLENIEKTIRTVNAEISGFTNFFNSETDINVKDALKEYLRNREKAFEQINDNKQIASKALEKSLFNRIKKAIAPNYWSELVFAFPNLRNESKGLIPSENLIEPATDKIYHLNLNKATFYKNCPSVINEQDLLDVIELITKAIDLNKPNEINMFHYHPMNNDIKIIFTGVNIDESYLNKIGNLYKEMIAEYNSNNVIKFSHELKKEEIVLNNTEYLNKAAKMLWLKVLIENDSSDNKKKKLKM
jgi:hypothetical protein